MNIARAEFMGRRYSEWANSLDSELRRAISDPGAWLLVLLICTIILVCCGMLPQTKGFFELEWQSSAVLFAPPFVVGIAGGFWEKRRGFTPSLFGAIALCDSAFFQWFAWSLVALSVRPGAFLLAAFPILLGAYHGHAYKASLRYPYQLIGTAAAASAGVLLKPTGDARAIIAVAGPATIVAAWLLGTIATARDSERRERDALRAAIDAQVLQERVRETELYKEILAELRAHNHDAGNTLSSALINSESLLRAVDTVDSIVLPANAREIAADLRRGLERLGNILGDSREVGRRESLPRATVDVNTTVQAVVREVATRYPATRVHGLNGDAPGLSLNLYGGDVAMYRLLSNLLLNACEGNGNAAATNVWLRVEEDGHARRCEIVIEDDGPGFSKRQLEGRLKVFESTKPRGSGLGLYTVERLVAANGGAMTRGNRSSGGAQVSLLLPIREA